MIVMLTTRPRFPFVNVSQYSSHRSPGMILVSVIGSLITHPFYNYSLILFAGWIFSVCRIATNNHLYHKPGSIRQARWNRQPDPNWEPARHLAWGLWNGFRLSGLRGLRAHYWTSRLLNSRLSCTIVKLIQRYAPPCTERQPEKHMWIRNNYRIKTLMRL